MLIKFTYEFTFGDDNTETILNIVIHSSFHTIQNGATLHSFRSYSKDAHRTTLYSCTEYYEQIDNIVLP